MSRWSSDCVLTDWCRPDRPVRDDALARHPRRRRLHSDVQRRVRRHPQTVPGCRAHAAEPTTGRDRRAISRSSAAGPISQERRTRVRRPCSTASAIVWREKPAARASAECAISPRRAIHSIRNVALATATIVRRSPLRARVSGVSLCGPASTAAGMGRSGGHCVGEGNRPRRRRSSAGYLLRPSDLLRSDRRLQQRPQRSRAQPLPSSFCSSSQVGLARRALRAGPGAEAEARSCGRSGGGCRDPGVLGGALGRVARTRSLGLAAACRAWRTHPGASPGSDPCRGCWGCRRGRRSSSSSPPARSG